MDENEVIRVIQKYLNSQKTKHFRQKGSGPDFLCEDGGVIETKGTEFNTNRALEQIVRYTLTYPKLEIAFPTDALSSTMLFALGVLEKSLKTMGKPTIGVILLAKVQNGRYKVKIYQAIEDLFDYINSKLEEKIIAHADSNLEQSIQQNASTMFNIESEISRILEEDVNSVMGQEIVE